MAQPEWDIVTTVLGHLSRTGFRAMVEVASMGHSIDIVALGPNDELWAIECKVSKMYKASSQAFVQTLVADRSWVAAPKRHRRAKTLLDLERCGVGLLELTNGVIEVTRAAPATQPW